MTDSTTGKILGISTIGGLGFLPDTFGALIAEPLQVMLRTSFGIVLISTVFVLLYKWLVKKQLTSKNTIWKKLPLLYSQNI